jgi:hypothetical protein
MHAISSLKKASKIFFSTIVKDCTSSQNEETAAEQRKTVGVSFFTEIVL